MRIFENRFNTNIRRANLKLDMQEIFFAENDMWNNLSHILNFFIYTLTFFPLDIFGSLNRDIDSYKLFTDLVEITRHINNLALNKNW